MSKKVIELDINEWGSDYKMQDEFFLCYSELNEFVDLDDKPEKIEVVFSSRPNKDSYEVEVYTDANHTVKARVFLSNGKVARPEIFIRFHREIMAFGSPCYISIVA